MLMLDLMHLTFELNQKRFLQNFTEFYRIILQNFEYLAPLGILVFDLDYTGESS